MVVRLGVVLVRSASSRPAAAVAGLAVGLVLVGGGYARGSIPSAAGVIQGCCTNASPHVLRVIDTATTAKCPKGTTALSWNVRGIPGAPAPTNLWWFANGSTSGTNTATGSLTTPCPVGYRAVGGGYSISGPDRARMQVTENHRSTDGTLSTEGWSVVVEASDLQPATFTLEVSANCISDLQLGSG